MIGDRLQNNGDTAMKKYPKKQQPKIGDKIVLDNTEYTISDLKTVSRYEIELTIALSDNEGNLQRVVGIETDLGSNYRDPKDMKYFSLDRVASTIRSRYE